MPKQKRKLAAIVFTDIVGFTKLSAGNEPAALALLGKQRELLKPVVEKHGGSWLKEIGDGLLLSFETTKDAVDCAIENQNRAQNISKEINNINWEISILQKLGFLYTNRGENDKGFEHFKQAKEKSDAMNFSKTDLAQNLMNIGWVYLTKGEYKIAAEQYLEKAFEIKKETGDDLGLWGSLFLYLSYKHLGRDYDVAHIKKLIDEENNIDFETNYMIYQLLGERSYLKTAYDQVKEKEDVLDTKLREKFYNYPTPKAIIEEWQMNQS